jgi:hypothetical protein
MHIGNFFTRDTYVSCRFWFILAKDKDIPTQANEYESGKMIDCHNCDHFDTCMQDYVCKHPDGRECLLRKVNRFQQKSSNCLSCQGSGMGRYPESGPCSRCGGTGGER